MVLMTLHSAKGLEFPRVYLSGMEDGLFPSMMSIKSEDDTDLEEERRLCYVGITRARQKLTLTSARTRMINGETHAEMPSRFIKEILRCCSTFQGGLSANPREARWELRLPPCAPVLRQHPAWARAPLAEPEAVSQRTLEATVPAQMC